jgi:cobalt-zinc-cadmium efflux system outer membrane protein
MNRNKTISPPFLKKSIGKTEKINIAHLLSDTSVRDSKVCRGLSYMTLVAFVQRRKKIAMPRVRLLLLVSLLLLSGCRGGPVVQETDRILLDLASRPFDPAPPESAAHKPKTEATSPSGKATGKTAKEGLAEPEADTHTVALLQAEKSTEKQPKYELTIPSDVPGSEAPSLPDFSKMTPEQKQQTLQQLYPELPPLPDEPVPQPGPNGQAYTLADLQRLAVENSPTLRQAVSDVKAAEGALVQAKTYQNPTIAYQASPTNNNSNAGAQGGYIDQPFRMWGKMKLTVAAAQKDLDNAQLALRRARSDLSTNVRNAYFALIVAKETMRVNRALARFTDEIYRLYSGYLAAGQVAPYEPAPLRASAYTSRLAYQQSIYNYIAAWKTLVATLGLPQLPLTEVAGRVDRLIPYYDYDKVLAYVLANHTDVLTARNSVQKARYNLQLAQITPLPDVDLLAAVWKESTIPPYVIFYQAQVVFPIPIWDRNRGNILSAQAALIRAVEETHRVENALTTTLATNYSNYQSNLKALEYYRRYILPDQVRYYRGVFQRRQADPEVAKSPPADLVTAQQALVASVQNYLSILSSLWSAVVSVADLIQTPDLFQLATPRELPELPNLDQMPQWLCPHHRLVVASAELPGAGPGWGSASKCSCLPVAPPAIPGPADRTVPVSPPSAPLLPAPRQLPAQSPSEKQPPHEKARELEQQLLQPPPDVPKKRKRKEESTQEAGPQP